MDPNNIPFNALIVGQTNSGKTQYLVNQLRGSFRGKFDGFDMPTLCPQQNLRRVCGSPFEHFCHWLPARRGQSLAQTSQLFFQGRNTLIVLDDYVVSKDVKGRTGQLVSLGFSASQAGISVWVLTQQITSIAKPYPENAAAIVLFYHSVGQNRESHLWRLRRGAFLPRVQGTDGGAEK